VAAPELLQEAIEQHFEPYVKKHNLSTNEILIEYCYEVMNSISGNSNHFSEG